MATYVYSLVNGEVVENLVDANRVPVLLANGYTFNPEQLVKRKEADTNNTGKLSDTEVKAAAKKAGIKLSNKKIDTLKAELGL